MTAWPSSKARRVLAALYKIGWTLKRQSGSHKTLSRPGWPDVVFAFHDGEEDRHVRAGGHGTWQARATIGKDAQGSSRLAHIGESNPISRDLLAKLPDRCRFPVSSYTGISTFYPASANPEILANSR